MNKDLTVGNPKRVLWQFSLPLFGSIIFQQLYNIADSLVAGKFIGENALAAVGNAYDVTLIFLAFAFGCNIGCSVVVARFFGAGRWREMKTAISTTFLATAALCGALMTLGFLLTPTLLRTVHVNEAVFDDCLLYLNIYIGGLAFLFFYNIATGIFSAMGDSKTPFLFLACSSTANIFVDILFVTAFQMGVAGVAWATFLCQGISCILALLALRKRLSSIPHTGEIQYFSPTIFREIVIIAVPSILQQSFISVGNIILQGIINPYGTGVVAGYAAAVKLNNMVVTSFTTIGNGISNFTAQNMGAGKSDRVHEGFKAGIQLVYLLCIPIVIAYFFFGRWLVYLFMKEPNGLAMDTGVIFLKILSPFYFVVSLKLVADGILRGAGSMREFMVATFSDLILRVSLAALFSGVLMLGSVGIWCAWPVGWIIGTGISLWFYKSGCWKKQLSEHI